MVTADRCIKPAPGAPVLAVHTLQREVPVIAQRAAADSLQRLVDSVGSDEMAARALACKSCLASLMCP